MSSHTQGTSVVTLGLGLSGRMHPAPLRPWISSSVWTCLCRGDTRLRDGPSLLGSPPPSAGPAPAGPKSTLVMKTRVSGREGQGDASIYCQGPRNTAGNALYRCCGATGWGGVDETTVHGLPSRHSSSSS